MVMPVSTAMHIHSGFLLLSLSTYVHVFCDRCVHVHMHVCRYICVFICISQRTASGVILRKGVHLL